jgi:hypothetical protein
MMPLPASNSTLRHHAVLLPPKHASCACRDLFSAEDEAGDAVPDVSHPSDSSNKWQPLEPMVKLAMQASGVG